MALVLVMVGLPARGKTFMARKLARYLNWLGREAKVFNVGNYRREHLGSDQPHSFFDPDNPEGLASRRRMAESAMDDLLAWLAGTKRIAIYDATNVTRNRRTWVHTALEEEGHRVVFVESVCTDPKVIEANIRETKLSSPDYANAMPDDAVRDFRARIAHYERAYEPLESEQLSWIKVIDTGRQVVVNRVNGWLLGKIVHFLMNLHIQPRTIYLTRHGESAFNPEQRIGGDPPLTPRGQQYAHALARYLPTLEPEPFPVWTSTLQRTRQTAEPLGWPSWPQRALDEIDAGVCDGLTYAEVQRTFPAEFSARRDDKLRYRYPRGESYLDVIERLEPVILELERQRGPVLVVTHNAVLRALVGYFHNKRAEECPHLATPLHTLLALTPKAYGCIEVVHSMDEEGNIRPG